MLKRGPVEPFTTQSAAAFGPVPGVRVVVPPRGPLVVEGQAEITGPVGGPVLLETRLSRNGVLDAQAISTVTVGAVEDGQSRIQAEFGGVRVGERFGLSVRILGAPDPAGVNAGRCWLLVSGEDFVGE